MPERVKINATIPFLSHYEQLTKQSSGFLFKAVNVLCVITVTPDHSGSNPPASAVDLCLTTIPVEGPRSSSMMKRYLRARKVARVDGINMQGNMAGEKSGCHPLGKMLNKSSSFSEFSCKEIESVTRYQLPFTKLTENPDKKHISASR